MTAVDRSAQGRSAALRARWQSLAPRERSLVLAAATVVGASLLWWVLLAPALQTLRMAPARHAELDAQLEHMQALAAEARALQSDAGTRPTQAEAQRSLQTATASLGSASRSTFAGDRATVVLQGASAASLAPWLAQVRSNARSLPVEAHLTRSKLASDAAGAPGAAPSSTPPVISNAPVAGDIRGLPGTGAGATGASAFAAPVAPTQAPTEARWDGRIVLALPAR